MKSVLDQLDDNNVFISTLSGVVHVNCSPWTSVEIEAAYQKSSRYKYRTGTSYPRPAKILSTILGNLTCNQCFKAIMPTDDIMDVPVLRSEMQNSFLRAQAQKAANLSCDCPTETILLSGCQNPLHS